MEINRQNQTAGDNAQQLQVETVTNLTIVNGISEQRVREIIREMNEVARRDYTSDAYALAATRVSQLESLLMDKVQQVEGMLEAFGDPSFQYLLAESQRRAAASERENDYAILAELLESRTKHGADRKIRTGISHAIKIVDEIDDDALRCLTFAYFFRRFVPVDVTCCGVLDRLERFAQKLLDKNLPFTNDWMEHLEILNAICRIHFSAAPKLEEVLCGHLTECVCAGIDESNENYRKACDILGKHGLSREVMVNNELLEGYVRLPFSRLTDINHFLILDPEKNTQRPLTTPEKSALRQVRNLYSQDPKLLAAVKNNFIQELQKRPTLNKVRIWWNRMPMDIEITQVGKVLAHANAQRVDKNIPDFLK